jgi:hypothetical protein
MPGADWSDVNFAFDEALVTCRQAWQLGLDIISGQESRLASARVARAEWRGRFADEFDDRMEYETRSAEGLAVALQHYAQLLAAMWASAMNDQNTRLRAREEEQLNQRNFWERNVTDKITGYEFKSVPQPPALEPPRPPGFEPTGGLVRY